MPSYKADTTQANLEGKFAGAERAPDRLSASEKEPEEDPPESGAPAGEDPCGEEQYIDLEQLSEVSAPRELDKLTKIPEQTTVHASSPEEDAFANGPLPAGAFPVGTAVEYWSKLNDMWINGKVLGVIPDIDGNVASYTLDIKDRAGPDKVRLASLQEVDNEDESGARPAENGAQQPATSDDEGEGPTTQGAKFFAVGTEVEFWSKSQLVWIPTTVMGHHLDAQNQFEAYRLDVKNRAKPSMVRAADPADVTGPSTTGPVVGGTGGAAAGAGAGVAAPATEAERDAADKEPEFAIGDEVDFWSKSNAVWLQAIVFGVRCDNSQKVQSYALDIKPTAKADTVRARTSESVPAAPGRDDEKPGAAGTLGAAGEEQVLKKPPEMEAPQQQEVPMSNKENVKVPIKEAEQEEPAAKKPARKSPAEQAEVVLHQPGEAVEFWSKSNGEWVEAEVLEVRYEAFSNG